MKFNKAQLVALIAATLAILDWLTSSGVLSAQATVKALIFTNFLSALLPPAVKKSLNDCNSGSGSGGNGGGSGGPP